MTKNGSETIFKTTKRQIFIICEGKLTFWLCNFYIEKLINRFRRESTIDVSNASCININDLKESKHMTDFNHFSWWYQSFPMIRIKMFLSVTKF